MNKKMKKSKNPVMSIESDIMEIYNSLLSIVPCHIYWKDLEGRYLGCNQLQAKNLGFSSPKEMIGKTDYEMPWADQAKSLQEIDQYVIRTKSDFSVEENVSLLDGKKAIFLSKKAPLLRSDGSVKGIIGISFDITEQKKLEQKLLQAEKARAAAAVAKKKAEAKTLISQAKALSEEEMRKTVMVLVGDIVHDLRTPIATIRNIGEFLSMISPMLIEILDESQISGSKKGKLLNKKQLNYIRDNTIVTSIQSAVKMMDDFINTALIELSNAQKSQKMELTCIDLNQCSSRRILENTLDSYPLDPGINLHKSVSYDFFLMGNSILIMKMLFNLIRNACEQIKLKGKGEIFVSTELVGETNLIKVKDTAGGAPPEVVSKIFDGYFTTKEHGTGIGLAFCKKTMTSFGGDLLCDNVYGDYIEFSLSFPKIKDI